MSTGRGGRGARRGLAGVAVATVAALGAAACTDDDPSTPAPSSTAAARTSTTRPVDDGILRIGVLLPSSGAGAPLGEPLFAAIELAVAEINQAGGVSGAPVELVTADEGDGMVAASKGVSELTEAGVDAVIGPASSRIALAVLGSLVDEGVLTCSPTATAISLTGFPDDGLFVRTIPSDALQAVAMAEVIEGAGVANAAVMAPNDEFGRSYTDAIVQALTSRGIAVTSQVLYEAAEEDHAAAVFEALDLDPGAIAFVGNTITGRQILSTVDDLVPAGLPVVVNDALRRGTAVDPNPVVGSNADITGTSPRTAPSPSGTVWFTPVFASFLGLPPGELPASFAANAYDCVNLIAVAALAARSTDADALVGSVVEVSRGGASCGTFSACRDFLEAGRNIDLNGASGQLELDSEGDVAVGWFDRFRFDAEGRDVAIGELQVSA